MTARAGGGAALRSKVDAHPEIYRHRIQTIGKLQVWLVDGMVIRDQVFIDFTEGGNSNAYAWMPPEQIWLDTDVNPKEQRFVLLHELHEYNRMADGLGYEEAHDSANVVEGEARRDPNEFGALWAKEVGAYRERAAKEQVDLDERGKGDLSASREGRGKKQ